MMRPDENTAWLGFLGAAPHFAGETITAWSDGPDPPDVICSGASGKTIGVELTKWVEHTQVTTGSGRTLRENQYLRVVRSEDEPRPEHVGRVFLYDKSMKLKASEQNQFREEIFALIEHENVKSKLPELHLRPQITLQFWASIRTWDTTQGAPIIDFSAYPILAKYLEKVWIHPRSSRPSLYVGQPWIHFESQGAAYSPGPMVNAAIDGIRKKIIKYGSDDIRTRHKLGEFDLLCFYCDEAMLHNTPIHVVGFGFYELAEQVKQALVMAPAVFDRIFLFHPHELAKVVQVYGR
jgi:hypothetical protein